ncbi:class II aldolase/adducin family protein [Thalassobaculum sp.]|uniref:class II aldolase/adducin family protein n=1 Tax=Thalassobaculum sp. TaxID=2022740 RepID=UPI0032EE878B
MMPAKERALRQQVIDTCLKMNALGINQGTSGNASVRVSDDPTAGFFITPSAIPYEEIRPEDIVRMELDGSHSDNRRPSSEWRFHLDIMRHRPDCGAIVHTHGMFATTLACLRMEIPAFHYMIAQAGGPTIRCSDYATFGTQELSDTALEAMRDRRACLLANHGMIAIGSTLPKALALALEVETLAGMYWRTLQVGKPVILPDDEIARVGEKFGTMGYGVVDKAAPEATGKAGGKGRAA